MVLMKDPQSKNLSDCLYSSEYEFAPFTFGPPELLPFLVANFASGDILIAAPSREEFIDKKIIDLNKHFKMVKYVFYLITNKIKKKKLKPVIEVGSIPFPPPPKIQKLLKLLKHLNFKFKQTLY